MTPDDFEKIKSIGTGLNGPVYLVKHKECEYAMKILKKEQKKETRIATEQYILTNMNHPFI